MAIRHPVSVGVSFPATLSVRIVRDSSGLPVSLRWLVRDISDRKRIEEQRAQLLVREQVARAQSEASQRFAFLADIGSLLVASLDCEVTLSASPGASFLTLRTAA